MSNKKIFKCAFCSDVMKDIQQYADHIESEHEEQMIPGMYPRQFIDWMQTKRISGSCIVCKAPTEWNPKTNKYYRFCPNPNCKTEYKLMFNKRMIGKYGKTSLLDDPEHQRKMLANRSISGTYQWSDHNPKHVFQYTGNYERDFLIFLDYNMGFDPTDLMSPSPHTYYYIYEGEKHFYFPDFFIPSLGLEIEIKDGGDNPNMHPKIQRVDKEKERLKDEVMTSKGCPFDYIKIVNKDHKRFLEYLDRAGERALHNGNEKIVLL